MTSVLTCVYSSTHVQVVIPWIIAYKGTRRTNPFKEEVRKCFPPGLEFTNTIDYEPTKSFIGPTTPEGFFRGSQKSIDLLMKIITLFISPYENTFPTNLFVGDPYMGTGAIGEAAAKAKCHFIGNDFCGECLNVTEGRLAKYTSNEQ